AVPIDQFWSESLLSIAGHRYRPYLESLTLPSREAHEVLGRFLETIALDDLELQEVSMTSVLYNVPNPRASLPWKAAVVHVDQLAHDLSVATLYTRNTAQYPQRLLAISPNSPYGRAAMIERDWEWAKTRVPDWAKDPDSGESPAVLAALGRRYTAAGQADDARDALQRYVRTSPEYWAYEMLANNYQARGDLKRWRETLDEFLEKGENGGLDHAKVRVEIAQHLMGQRRWAEAKPYAEAAAETWAGWAMDCAGHCNEGLDDFERAEYWFRNESERYANSFMEWFDFCKRTGHGNLAAASQLALNFVAESGDNLTENEKSLAVLLFDLANEPGRGVSFLRALVDTPGPGAGTAGGRFAPWNERMFLARFADAVDESQLRDESWSRVEKAGHPAAASVAAMFRRALASGRAKPIDIKALDEVLSAADPETRSYLTYFAGHFLARHGKLQDAVNYWLRYSQWTQGAGSFVPMLSTNAL
ncbi:MAG: hypothetical protein LC745_10975, partial [Planctomycetia bacterium]|nr:hypothetical protein [Planctomycetia bacterium]